MGSQKGFALHAPLGSLGMEQSHVFPAVKVLVEKIARLVLHQLESALNVLLGLGCQLSPSNARNVKEQHSAVVPCNAWLAVSQQLSQKPIA